MFAPIDLRATALRATARLGENLAVQGSVRATVLPAVCLTAAPGLSS